MAFHDVPKIRGDARQTSPVDTNSYGSIFDPVVDMEKGTIKPRARYVLKPENRQVVQHTSFSRTHPVSPRATRRT